LSKNKNKAGWYDGWFYATFIDKRSSPLRKRILRAIDFNQTVIDVGCGTGGFSLDIAEKASYVLGVDLSAKQIMYALKRKKVLNRQNTDFKQGNAAELSMLTDQKFDIAVMILMIHEIENPIRLQVLSEIKKCARQLILLDYTDKIPYNFWGIAVRVIEYFAGREHYANFRDYIARGGIIPMIEESGYRIKENKLNRMKVMRIITADSKG
jgi:demethylmenaquinone methyltransferase/2-methoxy-6-polyprenyl-1,4-benzoquinol methylase